jgi:hypothetical protein
VCADDESFGGGVGEHLKCDDGVCAEWGIADRVDEFSGSMGPTLRSQAG